MASKNQIPISHVRHDALERIRAAAVKHKPFTMKVTWAAFFHRRGARFDLTEMCVYKTEDLKTNVCLHRLADRPLERKMVGRVLFEFLMFSIRLPGFTGEDFPGNLLAPGKAVQIFLYGLDTLSDGFPVADLALFISQTW